MTKRILLMGLKPELIEEFREQFRLHDLEVVGGSDLEDLRAAFASGDFDLVVLGGGLDIVTRAEAVQTIFHLSDRATVHLKDQRSGPKGYVPFVAAVLQGFLDYDPPPSPDALLRAGGEEHPPQPT